ncbi:unnamed protein product, partial [Sphacelaria rigidula]
KGTVAANVRARQMLVASLEHQRDRDVLFRIPSPAAVWRELNDFYSSKTNAARLALLEKYDHVKIGVRDNPIQKLIEMEEVAKELQSHDSNIVLTEAQTLLKFVNALPCEYN